MTNIKNDESEDTLLNSKREIRPFLLEKTKTEFLRMVIQSTIHICGFNNLQKHMWLLTCTM